MKKSMSLLVAAIATVSISWVGIAFADDQVETPISEATQANIETALPTLESRQAKLLEKFGDQGIDADGDGTLTPDEVRAFFSSKCAEGPAARRGMKGRGHRGMGHHGRGPMGPPGRLLDHLEQLSAEMPPEDFDLARHPEADLDGDGELSDSEWAEVRTELLTRLLERFPEVDADGDGVVSDGELAAFQAEHDARVREHILARHPDADADGDGELSDEELGAFKVAREAEHRAVILERHPEADADGDGVLSDDEMEAFRTAREEEHRARILERHPEADLDGDGALSEEEMQTFITNRRNEAPKGRRREMRGRR